MHGHMNLKKKGFKSSDKITDDAGQSGNGRLGLYMPYFRPQMHNL